jgi:glucans biosynthesis protein
VEPVGDWGPGFVELVEIPTDRETHDNIVAFWHPRDTLAAGQPYHFAYRLHWCAQPPDVLPLARVAATRSGLTLEQQQRLFIVDFTTSGKLPDDLRPVLTTSAGKVFDITSELIEATSAYRVSFAFEPGDSDLSEFRLQLVSGGQPWSETWLYRWTQ